MNLRGGAVRAGALAQTYLQAMPSAARRGAISCGVENGERDHAQMQRLMLHRIHKPPECHSFAIPCRPLRGALGEPRVPKRLSTSRPQTKGAAYLLFPSWT